MADADEQARIALWHAERAGRIARRVELDSAFPGDPALAAAVREGFQPLIDAHYQNMLSEDPEVPDSPIVKNQNVW